MGSEGVHDIPHHIGPEFGGFFFKPLPNPPFFNGGTIIDGTKTFGSYLSCLLGDFEVGSGQAPPLPKQRVRLKEGGTLSIPRVA